MASAHRISQNYKLALHKMREALACFEKTGDVYRVCNAKQLIGESQWLLGHKDAATRSFEEVEMHAKRWRSAKDGSSTISWACLLDASENGHGAEGVSQRPWC